MHAIHRHILRKRPAFFLRLQHFFVNFPFQCNVFRVPWGKFFKFLHSGFIELIGSFNLNNKFIITTLYFYLLKLYLKIDYIVSNAQVF